MLRPPLSSRPYALPPASPASFTLLTRRSPSLLSLSPSLPPRFSNLHLSQHTSLSLLRDLLCLLLLLQPTLVDRSVTWGAQTRQLELSWIHKRRFAHEHANGESGHTACEHDGRKTEEKRREGVRRASPSSAAAASSGRFFFLAYSSSSLALTLTSYNSPHGCRQTAKRTRQPHAPTLATQQQGKRGSLGGALT